ncbi:alpha-2-HS-glycoprotein 2 [Oncorhynchus nerka]|uniref:alpha-2-HS-glycoprotein 2 n=1 Tax=Oncorhynchus nerka TaxID=8023 RepID=UPI0011328639|nr:alpha-2-HS-glycoprotein-like [Oncorhynchus nerka]
MMSRLGIALVLGLLTGARAQLLLHNVTHPPCDSPDVQAAALVAQDYLNGQHTHGYKYALNQIDNIKILTKPDGSEIYLMEVDLLETTCHVLDPTPVANCTVRPKVVTAVEGDCDVVLRKVGGVMSVTAFKCKTEESTEDLCVGCASLLPLNDTAGLAMVSASLVTFNNRTGKESLFAIMEVGRMSTQVVSGGARYLAEYVIVETNCTADDSDDNCVPLTNAMAQRGFCQVAGVSSLHSIQCNIFAASSMMPIVDTNGTVPVPAPVVHVHAGNLPKVHGLRHHKLTALHDPDLSGLLSAESGESGESEESIVPVVPVVVVPVVVVPVGTEAPPVFVVDPVVGTDAPVVSGVVKREAPDSPAIVSALIAPVPVCPGKKNFF